MKFFLLLGLIISLSSCNTYTRTSARPLALKVHYEKDEFKETETAVLHGRMIATQRNSSAFLVSITSKKQITPSKKQNLKLEFDLPMSSQVEKNFFFQIDSNNYQFAFDSIQYFKDETIETVVNTDSDGASTTTNTRRLKKSATLLFSIPDTIKNLITNSNTFMIRFYIDAFPYELTFHAHPKYFIRKNRAMSTLHDKIYF